MDRKPNKPTDLWETLFPQASKTNIRPTPEDMMIANDQEDDDVTGFSRKLALENLRTNVGGEVDDILSKIQDEEEN